MRSSTPPPPYAPEIPPPPYYTVFLTSPNGNWNRNIRAVNREVRLEKKTQKKQKQTYEVYRRVIEAMIMTLVPTLALRTMGFAIDNPFVFGCTSMEILALAFFQKYTGESIGVHNRSLYLAAAVSAGLFLERIRSDYGSAS